jgi:hypothetical protein
MNMVKLQSSVKKNARNLRSALTLREWPMIRTASSLFTFSSTDHHTIIVVVKVIFIMKNTQVDSFSKSDSSGSNPKLRGIIVFYDFLTLSKATTLQRHNTENSKQILPEKKLRGHSPNFHIHVCVCKR